MLRTFGLMAAFAAMLTGAVLATPGASAADTLLELDSVTIQTGAQAKIELIVNDVPAPGLGAWSLGVLYNPAVVEPVACETDVAFSHCNPDFAPNRVQVVGAEASGADGDVVLASITFRCIEPGVSDLTIVAPDIFDATEGDPQKIEIKKQSGLIACSPAGGIPELLGDVDCSGSVTSRDALLVLQYKAALISAMPCQHLGDVDGDGDIDSIDAGLIQQTDAGLIDPVLA